jgi:hypothetical protein
LLWRHRFPLAPALSARGASACGGRHRPTPLALAGAGHPQVPAGAADARPIGFFCDALRSSAGMLSYLETLALPASLHPVISDVDGRGTNLSVFLFIADLLVPLGDLLDWQLPWSRQHTMPMCPATPWGPSPANLVVANRPRGLTRDTSDVINCE